MRVEQGDGVGIPQGNRGGVGIGPVHEDLDGGIPVHFQVPGKVGRDHQAHESLAGVQHLLQMGVTLDGGLQLEILRTQKSIRQVAGPGGAVQVIEHGGDSVHVQGQGIAEEEEKEDGDGNRQGQRTRIADDLEEFFDGRWLLSE